MAVIKMELYDWFTLAMGVIGTLLCVYVFYLNDWDVEGVMFVHTNEDEDKE